MSNAKQTHGFQAEVKQLLHLMIHSLYSNKEIFLRELISNASDASDKLRIAAIADPSLLTDTGTAEIRIDYDAEAKTVTISDNGIGMTQDEVIQNIGTIARSGTRDFFNKLSGDQAKDSALIGQFGVGFYSAFIVAKNVSLLTRKAGSPADSAVLWESAGEGEYTLAADTRDVPGTTITLHLRDEETELCSRWRLSSIVKKYSDHIVLPILMAKEEWDKDGQKMQKLAEFEQVNEASALWTRAKSDISEEQYNSFYESITHDYQAPLAYTHNKVEGNKEYIQLLYIPSKAPFDLYDREQRQGLKLYVRRVFIMDDAEQLLPVYLRFVRGIIDSSDLPLNVSREILQASKDISLLKTASIKRILTLLEDMAEKDGDKYASFWDNFGKCLKEGLSEDNDNKARIANLLRFASTQADNDSQTVSLKTYISRMQPAQDKIYYLTADNYAAAKSSPHLEIFRKKGIEVLLLSDRVDEWMISYLTDYEGKSLQSVAKGALDLAALGSEEEKKAAEEKATSHKDLTDRLAKALGDKVKEVVVSARLTDSPACLVVAENEISANLERMLKAAGQSAPSNKPTLEINVDHPIIAKIAAADEANLGDWAEVVYGQALLAEGGQLTEPASFVRKLNTLILSMQ
jgi:molecular chaperone HtpG